MKVRRAKRPLVTRRWKLLAEWHCYGNVCSARSRRDENDSGGVLPKIEKDGASEIVKARMWMHLNCLHGLGKWWVWPLDILRLRYDCQMTENEFEGALGIREGDIQLIKRCARGRQHAIQRAIDGVARTAGVPVEWAADIVYGRPSEDCMDNVSAALERALLLAKRKQESLI